MNRLKLLAMAMLLAVPVISACGEGTVPPTPTGTVTGQVAIEGEGIDGVTVTLSGGVTVNTANGGTFSFTDVEADAYTVTISNYPEDASFPQTSAPATISEDGETVTVNFKGSYIRTSAIMGTVTVENDGLNNVTVKVTGMSESETLTGATGQFAFSGLRAGSYTIEISGFDNEDVGFGNTSSTAQLAVGESRVVSFEGTYLRASAVMGQVSVEGTGLGGVTVSLQGKGETHEKTTNGAGQFMFEELRRGDYAIGISGYDDDEYGFDVTSKTVMVPYGETENVPFEGTALRTAEVRGTVTVEGMGPLDGVTVSLSGKGDDPDPVVTLGDGRFSFERLHAGDYTISIFGFDTDKYGFDVTSENVTVALKETAAVEFGGIMLRTAAIEGAVTVKGGALPGVTVTVSGGPKDEEHTATTNGAGMYGVGELHAGDYSVAISGYDTREYGFEVTTKSVSVGLRETADVAFDGILLRTAGVSGRVTVDGEAMPRLTVTLSGEEDRTGMTNSGGQYAFSGLAAGDYTIAVSGYDEAEYEFPASMSVTLELDEAAIASFMGRSLRTVVIMGTVSAEGDALEGVAVTLIKVLGANSGEVLDQMPTDEDGGYMFDELLAGIYRVDLGRTDDEYDFSAKTRMGAVATDETAMWDFDATIIRTASVGGMVTVDGDGMADVMVMLSGDHGTDMDMETASDGGYAFEGLRKGSYTVSITNPDADMYDFPTMSRMVSLAVGQAQGDMSFAGSMLRRASISGQVYVVDPDMSLEGVMVTLDGDAEDEMMTDGNGEYNFPGLAGGDYEVSIENPNADAYTFEVMETDVDDLGDEEPRIVDFEGEHTATASISGVLFADEVVNDGMYTEGEPMLPFDSFPLLLQGPGLDQVTPGATDATGAFSFDALKAGQYNLIIDLPGELKAALAKAGYAFSGRTITVVSVPAATDMDVNFPFRITKQTIYGGALLANKVSASFPVGGVTMTLYPTAEDAEDGTKPLGSATTRSGKPDDPNAGIAAFEFDRADDTGPGGGSIDYLVYAKVTRVSNPDLKVHDDGLIEIEYEAVDRVTLAPATVKLINTRVNFQWWVKSNEDAKDGNRFLGGWKAKNGKETNSRGLATYSGTVTASQMASLIDAKPVRFTVEMDTDQADSVDMRELWTQSRALAHTHTGLENPATNTVANNDLGPIYVTWTTHSMVLGVYREADDVPGFTDYQSRLPGGDHRPVSSVGLEIALMARDSKNRLKLYKYDHDACTNKNHRKTDDRKATVTLRGGLAKVSCLPADDEFTIKFELGDDRVEIGVVEELGGYIEAYDEDDLSIGGTVIGTFGGGSGGVPEVRICLSSEGTSDDECATWGYQWETGSIVGKVGDQKDHRVILDPTTENHGAEAEVDTTITGGAYKFAELRDGVYDITAYSTRKYKVLGDLTQSVYVYHDETTGDAAVDTADWRTQRLGLKLMGYIGNDVNGDSRFRGDESVAGITVKLKGGGLSRTTTTDEHGHYKFENLPAGSYDITATSYTYEIAREYDTFGRGEDEHESKQADEYPALTEGEFRLPRWTSYTSRSLSNSIVKVCGDKGREPCANLYNFGLLYKDGQIEGGVNNISGSASNIDLVWTDVFTDRSSELTTNFRGEFTRNRLIEGDFTVKIEDAGWAVPMMRGSVPDDDGTTRAPTNVTGKLRGKDDFETMSMLHVYDAGASSDDKVSSSAKVSGRQHGTTTANYHSTVSWPTGWSRAAGTEETENASSIGTISWQSESVRFTGLTVAKGAGVVAKKGSTVCGSHRCVLDFNGTGSSSAGREKLTTLTVMVTAPNDYDDHEYSLMVGRAAPVDNYMAARDVITLKSDGTDSTVTVTGESGTKLNEAWSLKTRSSSASSATVRIDLETLGSLEEENEYCAQSVVVREYNDADTVEALNAPDDICRNTRYRLTTGTDGTLYELEVASEDGVKEVYYLEVNKAGPTLSDDATLASLAVDPGQMSPTFGSETRVYTVNVTHDVDTVTFTWDETDDAASSKADFEDIDDDTDGHQLELGDEGSETPLTITVTAEDGTELEYSITVHRPEEPVTDDATLSNITISEGTLTPPFEPGITEYTVGVPHDIVEVTAEWSEAHDEATSEGDPADIDDATGHQVGLGDKGKTDTLTITVTAADGKTKKDYTVMVTRLFNDDATLASLDVKPGTPLDPPFDGADARSVYRSDVAFDVKEVTLTLEPSDADATVAAPDADTETEGHQIGLEGEGDTTDIAITVTAENQDSTRVYTLKVYREKGPPEDKATLSDLSVAEGALDPSFRPDRTDYEVDVTHEKEVATITWKLADDNASTDLETPYTLELNGAGEKTEFSVTVTAEDQTTKETYAITVLRDPAPGIVFKRGGTVVSGFTIDEGDTAIYSVELATDPDPNEVVTVNVVAGDDIDITGSSSLTFDATAWNVPQNVEMESTADPNANQEDPVEITHTATSSQADSDYDGLADTLLVTLKDIHDRGVSLSSTGIEFVRGQSNTYTVVLDSEPTGKVVVSISGTQDGIKVNGGSSDLLNFAIDDWFEKQDVTVDIDDDTDTGKSYTADLTHRVVGADYDGLVVKDVHVKAVDDESPSVVVSRTAWSMDEETGQTYNIRLTQEPDADEEVTVRLIYNSGDFSVAYSEGGTAAVFTDDDQLWNTGINVTVTAVEVDKDVTRPPLVHDVKSAGGEDSDDDGDDGPKYPGKSASSITITVKDVPDDG